jgi:hypothetical protein
MRDRPKENDVIRPGDKFKCEDGIWKVLYLEAPGKVCLQNDEECMQVTYLASDVRTWSRA